MSESPGDSTPSTTTKGGGRWPKKSRMVILRLDPSLLEKFPSSVIKSSKSRPAAVAVPKVEASETPTPAVDDAATEPTSENNNGEVEAENSNNTPQPERKKPGPKPKRPLVPEGTPKPRGKPGPKKKPRLPDGTIDHSGDPVKPPNPAGPASKLNPKANQGAINANLRALDRTGKPCRKWQRKGIQLKSFTGVVWGVGTWGASGPSALSTANGQAESAETSDNKQPSSHGASESKSMQDQDVSMADAVVPDAATPMTAVGA